MYNDLKLIMKKDFDKTNRYDKFMKDNWAQLAYDKYYSELSPKQKKVVQKGIDGDKKHNKEDAKKLKKGSK